MLSKYRGVILGLAYADALGAGYEFFKGTIGEDEVIDFLEIPKITAHKKYEWSDDTAMTYLTLKAIQHGNFHRLNVDFELLSELFIAWYKDAPDKGIHTHNVLSQSEAYKIKNPSEQGVMTKIAKEITLNNQMTAGNGGLMRIAAGLFPLHLGGITDDFGIMKTASALNNLTHPHVDSERCCRLFLFLLHQLVDSYEGVTSKKDFYKFLHHWMKTLEVGKLGVTISAALDADLKSLNPNRYVVTTLSLAIGAIYQTWDDGISPKEHYINTIHKCIRVGDDTDTTSAVAGAMVGALYGEECLPDDIEKIFGYAGEQHTQVTYKDMVKTIDELF
jgi:ADP-ribosyl-[dinitrogen reductase] hydrolase